MNLPSMKIENHQFIIYLNLDYPSYVRKKLYVIIAEQMYNDNDNEINTLNWDDVDDEISIISIICAKE